MAREEGPLTRVAVDMTRVVEDLVNVGLGTASVAGKTVSSLMDSAADHVMSTVPEDAPVVGGMMGLMAQIAVAVLKTGGIAGEELSSAADRINDFVQSSKA